MKFKEWINCDNCEKLCKSIRIRKGRMLCYKCWRKKIIIMPTILLENKK